MENGNDKHPRYERKPNFDMHAKLSRDGRYWIIKRVETWILPRKYLDVIAENHTPHANGAEVSKSDGKPRRKGKQNADSNGQGN
ncbi:MAG: hypothetical protein K2X47_08035 [Bdellovibrionales bacterium]|nr:hypothetical protein [Bdellovibrionales bacterium]